MDLLKHLAIPQSIEHFHVLVVIGGLMSVILYPYLGFLLGSSILSYVYNRKGTAEQKHHFTQFAKDLIDIVLINKSVPSILALIPSFGLVFVLAQILQSTEAMSVDLAAYGFLFLLAGVAAMYAYKYTFRLRTVLHDYEGILEQRRSDASGLEEIHGYSSETVKSHLASGRAGVYLLIAASFLLVSSVAIAANPTSWSEVDSFVTLIISVDVLIRTLEFAALSAAATGVGILYFFFVGPAGAGKGDTEVKEVARTVAVRLIVASFVALPVFILASIVVLPPSSLSGSVYILAAFSLVLILLAAQFVYAWFRDSHTRYVNSAVFTFAISIALISLNDQLAIHNGTGFQAAVLASRFDQATEELKSKLGVAAAALTGEDIFNGRCSACHMFDQKKIGPAYKDVIPKYGGKKDLIMAFVLNPVKRDPAFPPMPNQGLKPAEADSIVSYILKRLGSAETKAAPPAQPSPQK